MEGDADFEVQRELFKDISGAEETPEKDSAKKKRGRPSKSGKGTDEAQASTTAEGKSVSAKAKAKAASGSKESKATCQCMCCGKIFARDAMANGRYCPDGKRITDRLYHAAKAQGKVDWLSEQLSTLEGSIRIVKAFKLRFPNWKTDRADTRRFLTQYVEIIQAETSVVYDADGIMMTEDRYVMEMSKAERGGLTAKAASSKFQALLDDPTAIRDTKDGVSRVRVSLDDHVRYQNKYSRLKQLIEAEAQRKNMSDEEKGALAGRVLSDHDRGFVGQDVDMLSMAQRMAKGSGRGNNAWDANIHQLGELTDLVQSDPGSSEKDAKGGDDKDGGSGDRDDKDKASDDDDDAGDSKNGSAKKWMDMDRAISRATRSMKGYIDDTRKKFRQAWKSLVEAEADPRTQQVSDKVLHELDVARARRQVIAQILSLPKDGMDEEIELQSQIFLSLLRR